MNYLNVSGLILIIWAVMALMAPWLPLQHEVVRLPFILEPPGQQAWLGFDELGRFIFDRLLMGAHTSFIIAISAVSVSLVVGTGLGACSAWLGGRFDQVFIRIMDIVLAFPGILLAIALAGALGPGIENVIVALVAVGWVGFARLTRAQLLSLKHRDHVQAAQALGVAPFRIVVRHLLPLAAAPLMVEASFGIAGAVISEAGLSFLGLGVQPPEASWGNMIRNGTRYMLMAPHMVMIPGLCLFLVVMAANRFGDRLQDFMNVRSKYA